MDSIVGLGGVVGVLSGFGRKKMIRSGIKRRLETLM